MAWRLPNFVVVLPLVFAIPAMAEEVGCQQHAGAVCGNGNLARIALDGGDASLSHGGDFTPVKTTQKLSPGDRVLLGAKGAKLVLGDSCTKSVSAGSLTTITRQGNLVCASEFAKGNGGTRELGDNDPGNLIPNIDNTTLLVGAGLLGAAGAGIAFAATEKTQSSVTLPVTASSQ